MLFCLVAVLSGIIVLRLQLCHYSNFVVAMVSVINADQLYGALFAICKSVIILLLKISYLDVH